MMCSSSKISDERTMDEIGWFGWVIDYWMEGVSSSIMQLFISSTFFLLMLT